jgi:hypothetical protein
MPDGVEIVLDGYERHNPGGPAGPAAAADSFRAG